MASILYIFPHPDDESFGPAPAIVSQIRAGHDVHLLTLTRGGATKQRHALGLDVDEMGAVRLEEMRCVERTLGLTSMRVLDLPDGGLPDLDPAEIETVIEDAIRRTSPDVLVTYAVHGISGHPDHLVSHAVVKSVFCKLLGSENAPVRLALFTLKPDGDDGRPEHLKGSTKERLAVRVQVSEDELAVGNRALACYETYRSVVEEHKPMNEVRDGVFFELFQESPSAMLSDITDALPRKGAARIQSRSAK